MNYKLLLPLFTILALSSCTSDDSFLPGPEPVNNGKNIYFYSDYEPQYVYGEQPLNDTIWIYVEREDANGKLTVPIIAEGDTCIHVPETVTFEDGDTMTYLCITAPYVEFTKKSDFTLRIPAEYADPYRQKEGTTELHSSVLWSEWITAADTVLFYSDFPTQGCVLENLRGQNRFRFTDFFGSGVPLEFSVKCDNDFSSKELHQNAGEINPLSNYAYASNGYWYFNNNGYTPWCPKGSEEGINLISFWPARDYTFIDFQIEKSDTLKAGGKKYLTDYNNHYSMMTAWVNYSDGNSGYMYIGVQLGYLIAEKNEEEQK